MASSRSGQDQSITGICDAMLMSMFVCCSEYCKCQFHIAKITLAASSDSCQCQAKGLCIETPGMSIVCVLHGRERLLPQWRAVWVKRRFWVKAVGNCEPSAYSQTGSVPMFPGTYFPRYRCSPVPMFPGTYVPRYLCSPVPMFPEPMFPGTDVPRYRCSPICG